ncbi:hypothetical protein QE152_g32132 [Popillia japonica]|uniref:Uncharacterized protein n=1 Tax=Popillia japonica TaxID=7064 RepID=A0AAW1J048_POPJA
MINDFTRVGSTSSCIDNVLANVCDTRCSAVIVECDLSDHYGQLVTFRAQIDINTDTVECDLSDHYGQLVTFRAQIDINTDTVYRRVMDESSMSQFVASFGQIRYRTLIDIHFPLKNVDVDSVADFLLNSYRTLIDIHFPLKKVRIRCNSDYPVRWFNAELRKMRNTVEAMRLVYTVTGDAMEKTAYDAFRKVYRNAIQTTKKRAYASFIEDSSHNK